MRLLMVVMAVALGCGDDDGGVDAGRDGGADAAVDAGTDAGSDAGTDVTVDAGFDAGPPARDRLMYVSVGSEPRLAVVELSATGEMTARADLDLTLPANPGAMTYGRSTQRLYIGAGTSVVTVALNGAGSPSLVGRTEGTGRPVYLSLAHDETVLVTAYFGDDRLKTHDVSGMPPHAESDSIAVDDEPHAALMQGNRVYVPHRNGNRTQWYDVAADGTLSFAGELVADPGVGPRHIIFSPDAAFAWVINEYADSITSHSVGSDSSLSALGTATTLPSGFDGDMNTCADVHVTPDGLHVYGSNRGHDSLAVFDVGADGNLTAQGQVDTEARPREFDMSPDGRFGGARQDLGAVLGCDRSWRGDCRRTGGTGEGAVRLWRRAGDCLPDC